MSVEVTVKKQVAGTPITIEGSFTVGQLPLLRMILDELTNFAKGMEEIKNKRMQRMWNRRYTEIMVDEAIQNYRLMMENY